MSDSQVPINYLSRAQNLKLKLIQGDSDTFSDALSLIGEYEGVLSRNESLAANLGAKLMGPRLFKALEGAFEGNITTIPPQSMFAPDPITWLDVVEFAKSNPNEFGLTATPNGRVCQFSLKGVQVEIGEDDWRFIISGALDRAGLVVPQPLEDDEGIEFATLEILEHRLHILVKKADEVAGRARVLNNVLRGRKASIGSRRSTSAGMRGRSGGFQPVNQARVIAAGPGYDIHADLLQQFSTPGPHLASQRLSSVSSVPATPGTTTTASSTPRTSIQQPITTASRPSPVQLSKPPPQESEDDNRHLVAGRIDKLIRGDVIHPPCDRCRRLRVECTKHLTACAGCTRKHARCVWKGLTEDEVSWLKGETGYEQSEDGDDETRGQGKVWHPEAQTEASRSAKTHEEPSGIGRPGFKIAVEKYADDVLHEGPDLPTLGRPESMDVDPRDSRQIYEPGLQQPELKRLSRVASAATAAADAAAASLRDGPGHSAS